MTKRFGLAVIIVSMLGIAAAYALAFLPGGAPRAAVWLIALSTAGVMVGVLILGAARGKGVRHRALRIIFIAVFLLLVAGFGLALLAPPLTKDSKLWLGLPQGAAAIMLLVGFIPMVILPVAYALTFEDTTLNEDELNALRARLRELNEGAAR